MRSLLMRAALAAAACLVSAVPSARADTVMTFSGWTNVEDNSTPYSLGENFTVDHAIQITALGYLDIGSQDHQVGIYDLSGNLLVSTTVDPSTDPLSDFFNYHTLATPITLAAGTYVLAGTDGPDGGDITYTGSAGSFVTDFQVAPGFSFFNDRFTASSTLAFPGIQATYSPFAWFGGDFQFTNVASVPEPSSLVIALSGALVMIGYAVRRRHKTAARLTGAN